MATSNTIFGKALHFPGAISNPENLIALTESKEWVENNSAKKQHDCQVMVSDATSIAELVDVISSYAEVTGTTVDASPEDIENLVELDLIVSKQDVGGGMLVHSDTDASEEDSPINISIILVLNDDYTGGEFSFVDHEASVSVAAGDVLVFPSHYKRVMSSVETGTKYFAVSNTQVNV